MKLRLFWTMLLAFVLVIVLGVGGMIAFFALAFTGLWQTGETTNNLHAIEQTYAQALGDYYSAQGDTWNGVERRLTTPPLGGERSFFVYVLLDNDGRVLATDDPALQIGEDIETELRSRGTPIEARNRRVGTFVLRSAFERPENGRWSGWQMQPDAPAPPDTVVTPMNMLWRVGRGFLSAGTALAAVLLGLAVIFAGWFSRPLRRMTTGAQQLAAGQLNVQVPGAAVRELDDLAQSFNGMARSLAEADRQRRQMTADIAHELRTPLTIIKGRLEGIQDGVYQPTPEQVRRLLDETALLERLVEDLRLLALAEAGQLPLYPVLLDPRDLLDRTVAMFGEAARAQGVALQIEAPDDLPTIQADPQRLSQVLNNLVANALRYTTSGGTITLRVATAAGRAQPADGSTITVYHQSPDVILEVSDTGQGIPAEDLPHIFDRFWRSDRARTRSGGGSGLGLAITRQIVAAHGGEIHAQSVVGQGTIMRVVLPAALAEA